jgi:hypothetical protein
MTTALAVGVPFSEPHASLVAGGTAANDDAATIVARDLGPHGRQLSETQRACLGRLLPVDPAIDAALRAAETIRRLDEATQRRVLRVISQCAPTVLGRAATARFLNRSWITPERPSITSEQYLCLGGSLPPTLVSVFDTKRGVPTHDEMAAYATVLYLCAGEYVTGRLLPQALNINERQAVCLANQLKLRTYLISEVARIMFGQRDRKWSATLKQLIAACRSGPTATT